MGDDARLCAVLRLAQAMAAAPDSAEAARAAATGARTAMDGSFAAVSVWERARGRLRVLVNDGLLAPGEETFPQDESYPVHDFPEIAEFLHERWTGGEGPQAWVERADPAPPARPTPGSAAGAPDGGHGPRRAAALRRRGRGSCVVAPIVLHGRAWGELYVARPPHGVVFGPEEAAFATVLAAVVAAGLSQHERLEEVRRLAFTDPLTGLGNRRAVDARLEEALERHRADGTVVSLVVCDLNGLKEVNDTAGHAAGDRLLERFGCLLSRCGAMLSGLSGPPGVSGALAARLGGDEFCLLAIGSPADEVVAVAEELCVRAGELEAGHGVACGVASTGDPIGPVHSARRLLRLADAAQYRAKAARAGKPVVAGREIVHLADGTEPPAGERRRFRGR
ncbi:GGDEF domain-containing protein [Streptomyces chumphonensis]|uniref:GGDEF domain-containing protein n=1 Tax=Streptomyces chumphonensis TaxID=1214925 RepID=A0A927IEL1_9ACTN|nr:GGDEF domain-containing protein [Streptomyces chumphonensis]MBD3933481.1 GGDEF domain-containing protein [Streptomyces chumphonensis]